MRGRHDGPPVSIGRAVTHGHHVAEEARGAPGVHHVGHAALEVRVALVEHRHPQRPRPVRDVGELVARATACEAKAVDHLELIVAQQVQTPKRPVLENQVVL